MTTMILNISFLATYDVTYTNLVIQGLITASLSSSSTHQMAVTWIASFVSLVFVSSISYLAVILLIPPIAARLSLKLAGKDLCKKGTPSGDIAMYKKNFHTLSLRNV
ncbi:unnamed protein product [Albugo candida]|uniref:Uncharacterized protein n=1 Tax=Albugo candida TaxID=65357 RepID=A0A024GSG6_9STRA|nr:unnamed protein product [Albugo candida]|eukprot:CCI49483.1 unnamed protein product [Albugo candida]